MEQVKVRLTFTEQLLGTQPADPELHTRFVASKAPDAKSMAEEIAAMGAEEYAERGMTVFPRMEDGTPFLWNYQVEGFFKEAVRTLHKVPGTKSSKTKAYLKEIDNLIFVDSLLGDKRFRRQIPLYLPMDIDLGDTDCQRPLRASTPQGERVALAHSEVAPAGTYIEFQVTCFVGSDKGLVKEWLDYGEWKGMGQWRNAGNGRFEWEEIG